MSEEKNVLTDEQKQQMLSGMLNKDVPEKKIEPAAEEVQKKEESVNSDAPEEVKKAEETKGIDFSLFKEKFEIDISDEESLKALIEKSGKYDELDKTHKDTLQALDEYKNIASKVNPLSHFKNENEYKRQQLLIKYEDELSKDAIKELSVLSPDEVKSLSDVDALKLQLMIDKGLSAGEANSYLLRKYGVDEFGDDMIEDDVRVALKVDAKDARRDVTKLYDGIEIPTSPDIEAARTQLRETWDKEVPSIINSIDKIDLGDGLDFVVTDEMKQEVAQTVSEWAIVNGLQPSEETGKRVSQMAEDLMIIGNKDKVIKSIRADLEEKIKADVRKDIHNDKPLDETTRATDSQLEDNDAKMRRMF